MYQALRRILSAGSKTNLYVTACGAGVAIAGAVKDIVYENPLNKRAPDAHIPLNNFNFNADIFR